MPITLICVRYCIFSRSPERGLSAAVVAAVINNQAEALHTLHAVGADLEASCRSGTTALMHAARTGNAILVDVRSLVLSSFVHTDKHTFCPHHTASTLIYLPTLFPDCLHVTFYQDHPSIPSSSLILLSGQHAPQTLSALTRTLVTVPSRCRCRYGARNGP